MAIAVASLVAAAPARGIVAIADVPLAGHVHDVRLRDDTLFLATEAGLEIVDLAEPRSPVPIATVPTPTPAVSLVLDGPLAYLACEGGLRIVEVADPGAPVPRGSVDAPGVGLAVEIAADHAHAFLATTGGIRILDVADPDAPTEVGALADPKPRRLARVGTALFGAVHLAGVAVLDVSDPTAPTPLPPIGPLGPGDPYGFPDTLDVRADGDRLWVLDETQYSEGVLRRFDVSNPAAPLLERTAYTQVLGVQDFWIDGEPLHLARCGADYGCTIVRQDLAAPPQLLAEASTTARASGSRIVSIGDLAYLANGNRLQVVDLSHPEWPRTLDSLSFPNDDPRGRGGIRGLDRVASRMYVAAEVAGLRIVDVSDPEDLVELGMRQYPPPRGAIDIAVHEPTALLADLRGVRVATVADPTNPYMVADPLVPTYAVAFADGIGFTASGTEGLLSWDLSDPANPQIQGRAPYTDARELAVADGRAYVVGVDPSDAWELVVVDVADPGAPDELGRVSLPEPLFQVDVAVAGSFAYVAVDSEVTVVDVSAPEMPLAVGAFPTCGYRTRVATRDGRLFAGGTCGLGVFDLADPVDPLELGLFTGISSVTAVEPGDGTVFVGSLEQLWSVELGPEYAPEPDGIAAGLAALAALGWTARRRAHS